MKRRDLVVWVKKEACRKWLVKMIRLKWSDWSDWSELEGGSKYQNWQSKSRRKANSGAGSGSRSIEEEDNLQRQGSGPSASGDGKGFREKKNSGANRRGLKKKVKKLTSKRRQNWYEGQGFQPQNRQHFQQFGRQERKGKVSRKKGGMGGGEWRGSKGLHIRRSGNQTDIGGRWRKRRQGLKKEGGSGWRRLEDDDDYDDDNSGNDDDNSGDYDDYGGEDGDGDYDSGSGWNQLETKF